MTDDQMMEAIKSVCKFNGEAAEKWRPEALAIGRAVEKAVILHAAPVKAAYVDWETVERMRNAEDIDSEEAGMIGAMMDAQADEIRQLRATLVGQQHVNEARVKAAREDGHNEGFDQAKGIDAKVLAMLMATEKVSEDDVRLALRMVKTSEDAAANPHAPDDTQPLH